MSEGSPEVRGHAPFDKTFVPHGDGVVMGEKVFVGDPRSDDQLFPIDLLHRGKVVNGQESNTQEPGYMDPRQHQPYLGDDADPFVRFHTKGEHTL